MFEKHQHKEQFRKDTSQKQEIKRISEESQQLLEDMNQTEIFEFCENSATRQCPDCNPFTEIAHSLQLREKFEVQEESYNKPEGE